MDPDRYPRSSLTADSVNSGNQACSYELGRVSRASDPFALQFGKPSIKRDDWNNGCAKTSSVPTPMNPT